MKKAFLFITAPCIILLAVSCGSSYTKSTFSDDFEFGYDAHVYTPASEIKGDFLYLSDSNDILTTPTPLMEYMLSQGYRVILPVRWGSVSRSKRTLDNLNNRLRGVSNTLEKLHAQIDSLSPIIVFAEGFYTPVSMQIALSFHARDLWLAQPLSASLQQTLSYQFAENRDTLENSLVSLWNIGNDSIRDLFHTQMTSAEPVDEDFYGQHYSAFLRSYWYTNIITDKYPHLAGKTDIHIVFHPGNPLYTDLGKKYWESTSAVIVEPAKNEEGELLPYSLKNIEQPFRNLIER